MSEKIILGYWGIRGRGQVPRLLLAYTGAVWEDRKYLTPESWGKDKQQLKFQFPNLPFLVDGDYKITESEAITNYIIQRAGKNDLLGNNPKQTGRIQMVRGVLGDIFQELLKLAFNKEWETQAPKSQEKLKNKFEYLTNFIGQKGFVFGHLTVVDFIISQASYFIEKTFPEEFKAHHIWQRVRDSVNNLPEIKKYYEQQTSTKGPFLPPYAPLQI